VVGGAAVVVGADVVGGAAVVAGAWLVVVDRGVVVVDPSAVVVEVVERCWPGAVVVVRWPDSDWFTSRSPASVGGNSHSWSSEVACDMKSAQICAGHVPPETSSPRYSSIACGCS
jgi:hypothetical protein